MIEFVGPPASGKSTLCASLAGKLLARTDGPDLRVTVLLDHQPAWIVQLRKVVDASAFALRHPLVVGRLLAIVVAAGQRSNAGGASKTVNLLAELRRSEGAPVRLADQGVLQAIWSLELRAIRPVAYALVAACRPWLPTTIVRITAHRTDTIYRLDRRHRGRSRLDRTDTASRAALLEKGERILDHLVDYWLAVDADHRLIVVDVLSGDDPGSLLAAHIPQIEHRLLGRKTS